MMEVCQSQVTGRPEQSKLKMQKEEGMSDWGPVLVEKRPTIFQRDGRMVLEKAQDRKKKINLEEPKGITCNSFVLSQDVVSDIAGDVGIKIGTDSISEKQIVLDMIEEQENRKVVFDKMCSNCKGTPSEVDENPNLQVSSGELTQVGISQLGGGGGYQMRLVSGPL
jgi:hypothetical protein